MKFHHQRNKLKTSRTTNQYCDNSAFKHPDVYSVKTPKIQEMTNACQELELPNSYCCGLFNISIQLFMFNRFSHHTSNTLNITRVPTKSDDFLQ